MGDALKRLWCKLFHWRHLRADLGRLHWHEWQIRLVCGRCGAQHWLDQRNEDIGHG